MRNNDGSLTWKGMEEVSYNLNGYIGFPCTRRPKITERERLLYGIRDIRRRPCQQSSFCGSNTNLPVPGGPTSKVKPDESPERMAST